MSSTSTVVLVHGAMTDASVWHRVIAQLQLRGRQVVAPAIPMRSLAEDAAHLRSVLDTVDGPVLLVGHSYGGSVISVPAALMSGVRGLVFAAAFQPEAGETSGELNGRYPGGLLGPATTVVRARPGGADLYLRPECFAEVYAHDVDAPTAAVMAAAQHPIDPAALGETFNGTASWRTLPSWAIIATDDFSIPTAAQRFMAERAGSTVMEVASSHAVPVSHPISTVEVIQAALDELRLV